jgi:hypothetical protein
VTTEDALWNREQGRRHRSPLVDEVAEEAGPDGGRVCALQAADEAGPEVPGSTTPRSRTSAPPPPSPPHHRAPPANRQVPAGRTPRPACVVAASAARHLPPPPILPVDEGTAARGPPPSLILLVDEGTTACAVARCGVWRRNRDGAAGEVGGEEFCRCLCLSLLERAKNALLSRYCTREANGGLPLHFASCCWTSPKERKFF